MQQPHTEFTQLFCFCWCSLFSHSRLNKVFRWNVQNSSSRFKCTRFNCAHKYCVLSPFAVWLIFNFFLFVFNKFPFKCLSGKMFSLLCFQCSMHLLSSDFSFKLFIQNMVIAQMNDSNANVYGAKFTIVHIKNCWLIFLIGYCLVVYIFCVFFKTTLGCLCRYRSIRWKESESTTWKKSNETTEIITGDGTAQCYAVVMVCESVTVVVYYTLGAYEYG